MNKHQLSRRHFNTLCAAVGSLLPTGSGIASVLAVDALPRTVKLPNGASIPALGQGSARLGQGRHPEAAEEEALRTGLSLGMTLIDTAEIYGNGNAERLISHVIAGQRDRVLLVSKVWPNHVVGNGIERACDASLARLGTDQQHNRGRELLPVRRTLFYIDVLEFRRSVRAYCERPATPAPQGRARAW
jgi:hypothetical protein